MSSFVVQYFCNAALEISLNVFVIIFDSSAYRNLSIWLN